MTKQGFIKRVRQSLAKQGVAMKAAEVENILRTVFETVKDVVAEGDVLYVNGLGRFYAKDMASKVVRGGLLKAAGPKYVVPARKKLGFSSFASADGHIQRGRVQRDMDGLFADVLSD